MSDICAVAVETGDPTVSDHVAEAVIDAFDCHQIWSANKHLKFDRAVATFVVGFRDDSRTELARDVRVLTAMFIGLFAAAHPAFNQNLLRVGALLASSSLALMFADLRTATLDTF